MKKLLAILVLVLMGTMSYAQTNIFPASGNVGVGTTVPATQLHVYDPAAASTLLIESNRTTDNKGIANFQLKGTATGDMFMMTLKKSGGVNEFVQSLYKSSTATWLEFVYLNYNTKKYELRDGIVDVQFKNSGTCIFSNGGAVGIGTTAAIPAGVKLAVNGKLNCKEVEVTLSGWSDFVFNSDYKLRSLYDVENFIAKNKHLPDVPSESEVLANGVNLGEMNAVLLQKVEELTLYMIELKKENDLLKVRMNKLEK